MMKLCYALLFRIWSNWLGTVIFSGRAVWQESRFDASLSILDVFFIGRSLSVVVIALISQAELGLKLLRSSLLSHILILEGRTFFSFQGRFVRKEHTADGFETDRRSANYVAMHQQSAGLKALSPTTAISASRDSTMRLWNVGTEEREAVLEEHTSTIRALAVHDDTLVSASFDHDARVWSLERKECLKVLKGHEDKVYSVAFDGERIVTGSLDKTARLWDPASGQES